MATYQCQKCGIEISGQSARPSGGYIGPCSVTGGNHIWGLVSRMMERVFDWL